ncbi:MAG: hypothetical protein FD179_1830 [Erysipelotrichaceae bacterium]|nr:MAG: hypothetical protein FD179_1830 [Erysipelotrichaceae bacterium]
MKNNKVKTCKTHDCDNEAIVGKYCAFCTQLRKEKRAKIFGTVFGFVTFVIIAIKFIFKAIRSGTIKKGVTAAIDIFRAFKG